MKVLIFGTTYIDTETKQKLACQWDAMHEALNPGCDLLLVDSDSLFPAHGVHSTLQLGNNIGHLSRGGQDGWGRAFCAGLQYAIYRGYDYAVHIEGDSLCKLDVMKMCKEMWCTGTVCCGTDVIGTKHKEKNWVETGLMFFDVQFLQRSQLITRYDWNDGGKKRYPNTPEAVLFELLGNNLTMMPWFHLRDDVGILKLNNVNEFSWITHAAPEVFDAFFAHNVPKVPA